jgi:hypothetical protein
MGQGVAKTNRSSSSTDGFLRHQLDAKAAAQDADWPEQDASAAIDCAVWAVDSAQLTVLDALDARAYADERAKIAGS